MNTARRRQSRWWWWWWWWWHEYVCMHIKKYCMCFYVLFFSLFLLFSLSLSSLCVDMNECPRFLPQQQSKLCISLMLHKSRFYFMICCHLRFSAHFRFICRCDFHCCTIRRIIMLLTIVDCFSLFRVHFCICAVHIYTDREI